MPSISIHEAVEKLTRAVESMAPYDLLDFYNEVFPEAQKSALSERGRGAVEKQRILEHFAAGLEIDEILDFWRVAFPGSRKVEYDDETDTISYRAPHEVVEYDG